MGRVQRLPDPEAGPVERFAYELQKRREEAGGPDYRSMSRRAACAPSTLSTAAAGKRLPTLETTLAYVRACGADEAEQAEWARRWKTASRAARPDSTASAPAPPQPASDSEPLTIASERHQGRVRGTVLAIALIATATLAGAAIALHVGTSAKSPSAEVSTPSGKPVDSPAETIRRHSPLTMRPGQSADLDPTAWPLHRAPGTEADDIEFTLADQRLTGSHDSVLAWFPEGSAASRRTCAIQQEYGISVPTADLRTGLRLCVLTDRRHLALLQVTEVRLDADGTPERITFDATVWERPHQS
ncbi:hypothetical protein ACH427_27900 [Streptomyces sp. NPDC020379]|uniref:hypothetical protein n=1 Tax=Streptomyces sp. NPDC020379 TaxID=3365071 RepID=UPI0037BC7A13